MVLFKVVFFTKGFFVKDPNLRYEGGDVYAYKGQDSDFWSFFEARGIMKEMDDTFDEGLVRLWWKHESGSLDEDLKPFRNDTDATAMSDYARDNKCDVELYVEPKVNLGNAINVADVIGEQKGKGVVADEIEGNVGEADSDGGDVSSDDGDSIKGTHFGDSEEERMVGVDDGFDDGFNNVISEPQLDPNNATEDDVDGVTGGVRNLAKSLLVVADDVTNEPNLERPTRCLITPEMEKEHVIEDGYLTDELDSASDNSSDGCETYSQT